MTKPRLHAAIALAALLTVAACNSKTPLEHCLEFIEPIQGEHCAASCNEDGDAQIGPCALSFTN